jgi:hypothetical protein
MGFRYRDELELAEATRISEVVIARGEHAFEVDPALMVEHVTQQPMPRWDTQRIARARSDYLEWMHRHFARRVVAGSTLIDHNGEQRSITIEHHTDTGVEGV